MGYHAGILEPMVWNLDVIDDNGCYDCVHVVSLLKVVRVILAKVPSVDVQRFHQAQMTSSI